MRRSLAILALAAGVTAGAAGAAVRAQEPAAPAPAAPPAPIPIDTSDPTRLPDGRYDPNRMHYRVHSARIAVRADDPAGGLSWAVRVLDVERLKIDAPTRSLAGAQVIGRDRCVQLGRLQGETFGWIYGDGRFRATGTTVQLLQCTPRKRPRPVGQMASALAVEDPAAPRIVSTVLWGLLPGARTATVAGSGAADGPAATSGGVFLRVAGPDAHPGTATVTGGGGTVRLGPGRLPSRITDHFRFPTLVPGSETVEAPAPDPSGGPGWAMAVAETEDGGGCSAGPTRVVDGRGGGVDLRLALFYELALTGQSCRPLDTRPTAERPCDVGTGFSNVEELGAGGNAFLERARVERRVLPGRLEIYAQCSADVERVTLSSPRDLRTLAPSTIAHVILAVYDGDFVDGEVILTAHLRGGKTWTERVPLGNF